jgi:phage gpG-like protein
MIGISCKTTNRFNSLKTKARQAGYKNLGHAAAVLRKIAIRSIHKRKKPSRPGSPPHTQTGRLKKAILYYNDRNRQEAIIGPSKNIIGIAGAEHEHGGRFRRERFPARPYMGPALEKIVPSLPPMWAGSIK